MIARVFSAARFRDYGVAAAILVVAADRLIFESLGYAIGLPVPLFLAAVALAAALCHRRTLGRAALLPALLFAGALLALVESVGLLSFGAAILGLAAFALAAAKRLPQGPDIASGLARFAAGAPFAFLRDEGRARLARRKRLAAVPAAGRGAMPGTLLVWIMPLVLAIGFVLLLALGNPIVDGWLALVDLAALLSLFEPARLVFWAAAFAAVWAVLRPRIRRSRRAASNRAASAVPALKRPAWVDLAFGPAAILRALLLFNAVFAVETGLDAVYLWAGAALPAGIGHAKYAHRGAYTLVATALLAAAFVLVAMRPGSAAAHDRRIRALVYLWTGQTILLVFSAMLRLDLYVDTYALTHWRVAAFLWMGQVAAGLVLILVRIAAGRSNRWLVGANFMLLGGLLYATAFVDVSAAIARFNVAHSREAAGGGDPLDIGHLLSLGPSALPALDRYIDILKAKGPIADGIEADRLALVTDRRRELVFEHYGSWGGWRSWTYRGWRLSRYLQETVVPPVEAPPGSDGPRAGGPR